MNPFQPMAFKGCANPKKDPDEGFIEQTAHDYDMKYYDVMRIYKLFPDRFYEELELFIKRRANQ